MLILLSFYKFYFYSWILVRLSPPEICQYHLFLIFLFMYEEKVTFPEWLLITVLCVVICLPDWNWDVVLNCFPIFKKTKVLFWRIIGTADFMYLQWSLNSSLPFSYPSPSLLWMHGGTLPLIQHYKFLNNIRHAIKKQNKAKTLTKTHQPPKTRPVSEIYSSQDRASCLETYVCKNWLSFIYDF